MNTDDLRKKFIVSEETLKSRLEPLVEKAMKHCVVASNGAVHINDAKLSARDKVKLILTARAIASQLDSNMSSEVTVDELVENTGLQRNVVRARISEIISERFAESQGEGSVRANPHKIEAFLDSLQSSR